MVDFSRLPAHKELPHDFYAIIEIPLSSNVKYEYDKDSGMIVVDRILSTSMTYPANYGFVPNTLADDGDPLDVLIINDTPLMPGAMIRVRPIGMLAMSDEGGQDEKVICVPHSKVDKTYEHVQSLDDLPSLLRHKIKHFFEHYKDLEQGKWVKVDQWADKAAAEKVILASAKNYKG